jgi:predicted acetyltransferase
MLHQLADAKARGEAGALLWASEGNIYQRFGYGLASLASSIDVDRDRAAFRTPAEWSGTVRLVDQAEAMAKFPEVHDPIAAVTPGFWKRNEAWWDSQILGDPPRWREGFQPQVHAAQRARRAAGRLCHVPHQVRLGRRGLQERAQGCGVACRRRRRRADVWQYLFGVDLIAKIHHGPGPVDHPLLLMLAEPRRLSLRVGDGLWLRILDVPAALSARGYSADGDLVIEVVDEVLPEVAGRWRVSARGGRGEVTATDQPADLQLDITDLGAVYLGGFTFRALADAGRGAECTPGAIQRADLLFATDRKPWSPHVF